jgi:hypothetical protein
MKSSPISDTATDVALVGGESILLIISKIWAKYK